MASDLMKLSLLLDDDFGILLAAESLRRKPKSKPPKFDLDNYENARCKTDFRFHKADIYRLVEALKMPHVMRIRGRTVFKSTEGYAFATLI